VGRRRDAEWLAAYEELAWSFAAKPVTGYRVGRITEADKYGDDA
jgi:hypothetical protein